jgi:hypothetical protein
MANEITYIQSPLNKSRKDKFLMVINIPPALREISSKQIRSPDTIIPESLQFSIYGHIVPDIEVPAVTTPYAGHSLLHTSHARKPYQPNSVKFTIDNRFNNYWFIYKWLKLLNDDQIGVYDIQDLTSNKSNLEYRCDISIFGLDEYNKKIIEFKYIQSFPTGLGGIEYDYRNSNEMESSFTYDYSQLIVEPLNDYI